MKQRKLSPYEKTHLARFGRANINIDDYAEMPVEYITGQCEFNGLIFKVDENVLIPRVESEDLVNLALDFAKGQKNKILNIAEIGTGAGAIGLSLAHELEKNNIKYNLILSDVSEKALKIARENCVKTPPASPAGRLHASQVKIIQSDLMSSFNKNLKFNLIIANLPYIPSQRVSHLDESVKNFEPHLALDGGPEGLTLIYKLLNQIIGGETHTTCLPARQVAFLQKNGLVLLEIDHTHKLKDFLKFKNYFEIEIKKDEFGQNRFAILKRKT